MDRMSLGCGNGGSRKKDGDGLREGLRRRVRTGNFVISSDTSLSCLVGGCSRAKNGSTKNLRSSHYDRERKMGTRGGR